MQSPPGYRHSIRTLRQTGTIYSGECEPAQCPAEQPCACAEWRDLGHEREKVQPRPAAAQPEFEEKTELAPVLPRLMAAESAPEPFGNRLLEPTVKAKKRRKNVLYPTADQNSAQISLFD